MDKRNLDNIKIPENLDNVIDKSFKRAKNDKKKFIKRGMAAVIGFGVFTGGMASLPTLAENFPIIEKALEKFGIEKDTSLARYIGQEKEMDGITFKIEEIIYTEHKIAVAVSAVSDKKFDKNDYRVDVGLSGLGDVKSSGSSTISYEDGENRALYYYEMDTTYSISPTGNLKINIVETPEKLEKSQELRHISFDEIKINEKKNFKAVEEICLNNDYKFKFNKYSSVLLHKGDESEVNGRSFLKVDNKYKAAMGVMADNNVGVLWDNIGFSKEEIENAKEIEILAMKFEDENAEWFQDETKYEEEQGVKFIRENKFENGTVGKVMDLERIGNKVTLKYKTEPQNLYNLLWAYSLGIDSEDGGIWINPVITDEGDGLFTIEFSGVSEKANLKILPMVEESIILSDEVNRKIK